MYTDYPIELPGLEIDDLFRAACYATVREMFPEILQAPRATVRSRYRGVNYAPSGNGHTEYWRARYLAGDGRWLYGPCRPATEDGELQAAWDTVRAMGWDAPRLRKKEAA